MIAGFSVFAIVVVLFVLVTIMMGIRQVPQGYNYTVGRYGVGSLKQLVSLVALFYVAIGIFVTVILGAVMRLAGLNIFKFLNYLR